VGTTSAILIYFTLGIFWLGVSFSFLGIFIAWLEYTNYTYRLDEFNLIMKKGILDRKETSIPSRQIQDVNIDESLFYRFLGLSSLVLKTAGTEEKNEHGMNEIRIDPIDENIADEIQKMLERKIGVQVIEDDVKADKEVGINR
jgi:putative membrane protein